MVKALIFDFDGLILETEEPLFLAWQEAFHAHGVPLTVDEWAAGIGAVDQFDPLEELERRCGRPLDREQVQSDRRHRRDQLLDLLTPCHGVTDCLDEAAELGLRCAVASSSPASWVTPHLDRIGLLERFEHLSCFEGMGAAKPAPDLYLAALDALGVGPEEAVAFEDSHNGLTAAKAAGIWCVVVPTPMTRRMDFARADLVVQRLGEPPLGDLLDRLYQPVGGSGA